jgi:hypothetical protein
MLDWEEVMKYFPRMRLSLRPLKYQVFLAMPDGSLTYAGASPHHTLYSPFATGYYYQKNECIDGQ